jgi:hypothetical protein
VTYSDPGRDKIVENLNAAIDRLRIDVARVEMWAIALVGFSRPIPDYQTDQFILPPRRGDKADTVQRSDKRR